MGGGATEVLPLVDCVLTKDKLTHVPHEVPFVESAYSMRYPEIGPPVPAPAPLHERVTLPSDRVEFTLKEVGAVAPVNVQRMLLLVVHESAIAPSASVTRMR